jgi:hypothetical protein
MNLAAQYAMGRLQIATQQRNIQQLTSNTTKSHLNKILSSYNDFK